ncbi:MAG: 2-C-methyl-D-erythritol 2,4-cyclodiphosphate synthase [Duganella sp.]
MNDLNDIPRYFALLPTAGVGARMGADGPKQYLTVAGKPLLRHAVDAFRASPLVAHTYVVVSAGDDRIDTVLPPGLDSVTVLRCGGATRMDTVLNALRVLRGQVLDTDLVLVHDAARPGLTPALIEKLVQGVGDHPAGGLLALPVVDTVKRCADGVVATVPRNHLWLAQTPQMFSHALLLRALENAPDANAITDDASAVEMLGLAPRLVEGHPRNLKVTLPADIRIAEMYLAAGESSPKDTMSTLSKLPFRIGQGYDCHALVENRKLIIGGVDIPHHLGLLGHSDADVLLHAITDAILGAAALGDIGKHFPDTDPQFKGADSRTLLKEAARRVVATGYRIGNIDATIIAQKPKMAPHIAAMCANVAEDLGVAAGQVNIKAKTNEKLGYLGREEGIAAEAVALLLAV